MKRIVSLVLVVMLVAALFVGCSKSGSPEGTYYIKSMGGVSMEDMLKKEAGEEFDLDSILSMFKVSSLGELITMELKADGTVSMKNAMDAMTGDEDAAMTGTWTQDGSKITITIDGDAQEFTLDGNELTGGEGDEVMVFVKQ